MEAESGVIKSPGYPVMNHLHRSCEWSIKVPKGRRVTFELLDFDLDKTVDLYEQGLGFFNGENFISNNAFLKGGDTTRIIESSDNFLLVFFWSAHASLHRGFKAKYSSDKPSRKLILNATIQWDDSLDKLL